MLYEDLHVITSLHYEKILSLEAVIEGLRADLKEMTRLKEDLQEKLARKSREYDELTEKFEQQTIDLLNEKQAHRLQINENHKLEEEIKDLKMQIADNLDKIAEQTNTIEELEE